MSAASLFMVTLIVPEMDDAIRHFTRDWGFHLINDSWHASGHRWVEIDPGSGARLRLAEAINRDQRQAIGNQAGGRVAFFLRVVALDQCVATWAANGIEVVEPKRSESYGKVVVLKDKYGNRWDVLNTGEARQ